MSTYCSRGHHALCQGMAGIGKNCECECHTGGSGVREPRRESPSGGESSREILAGAT